MNSESNRLQTFRVWPTSAPVDPPRIAKAGFYYTGSGLEVQCFSCQGKLSQWNYGDQVMWKHRQLKPNCPFVLDPMNSGNIPLVDAFEASVTDDLPHWQVDDIMQVSEDTGPPDYGLTEEDEMYRNDALRLLSFTNWDNPASSREALVNAGFYHAGGGRLRCAWCGGELDQYTQYFGTENPIQIHRLSFPQCDHAARLEAAQLSNDFSTPSTPSAETPPVRSPVIQQILSSGAAHNSRLLKNNLAWRTLGVVESGPSHPNQTSLSSRLATFERWPADRTQTPRALAEAGFFHTGTDDQVRCFYCDGGLGKWEAGDAPWSEHARWFPHCGYVLLVKGHKFVEECRDRCTEPLRMVSNSAVPSNRNTYINNTAVDEGRINEWMESCVALEALSAGLDAARVRRALVRRYQTTGTPFSSSDALMDAALGDQLNEEAWSTSPQNQRLARDILAETLRELVPTSGVQRPQPDDRPDSQQSDRRTRTPSPNPSHSNRSQGSNHSNEQSKPNISKQEQTISKEILKKTSETEKIDLSNMSLEEENRQLKEARLCKVCMDGEVSVVFLPCGHLVSCARCGAALSACPLCRSAVRALVRAYLA